MNHTRILFIGNSYTYYNELWNRVAELAALAGENVTVDHVTCGGYYLRQMADPTDPYGATVAQKLSQPNYDVVILQEQSLGTFLHRDDYEQSVAKLAQAVRKIGARPILYQTWARKQGNEKLTALELTPEHMTELIATACCEVGNKYNIEVSPVGTAFFDVVRWYPEIELYDPDGSHPSPLGTALAALCLFETVFGRSPIDLPYLYGTDHAEYAERLKASAHLAVIAHSR